MLTRVLKKCLLVLLVVVAYQNWGKIERVFNPSQMVSEQLRNNARVVLYATDWCGYCKALRSALVANKIPFTEHDVEQSFEGQLGFWTLRARGVPVSVVGPQVIHGYQMEKLQDALEKLDHPFDPILAYRDLTNPQ